MPRRMALVVIALCFLLTSGCAAKSSSPVSGDTTGDDASFEATVGAAASLSPPPPPPPMLSRPETAAYSYLLWISHAYIRRDSNVASSTFDPFEDVRVDAYIQHNNEENRILRQEPTAFDVKSVVAKENTATVSAFESWRYRYIDAETGAYSSPTYVVSYDSTYTLVKEARGWVVHQVEAQPRGEIK